MNKIFWSAISSVMAAFGLSLSNRDRPMLTNYYWFVLNESSSPMGRKSVVTNSGSNSAVFYLAASTVPIWNAYCDGYPDYQCLVGFVSSQIYQTMLGNIILRTSSVGGPIGQPITTAPTSSAYVRSY